MYVTDIFSFYIFVFILALNIKKYENDRMISSMLKMQNQINGMKLYLNYAGNYNQKIRI